MRELAANGWGAKRIARELGLARNTVRRYLRGGPGAEIQERPAACCLGQAARTEAVALFDGAAEGNAVVVADLLAAQGVEASVRTVQRAAALATMRFETARGRQMQIDFGERRVWIAGEQVTVHFLAAVLSYSRRGFAKAFLHERQGEWLDGIASPFRHFGGVPAEVLGDNSRCLVAGRNREAQTVVFHPAYLAFCRDWDVQPRACQPYRARTPERLLDPALARGKPLSLVASEELVRITNGSQVFATPPPPHLRREAGRRGTRPHRDLAREKRALTSCGGVTASGPPARAPTRSSRRWRSAASTSANRSPGGRSGSTGTTRPS